MAKAFSLLAGTGPSTAYVADPAGGQARNFIRANAHSIQAADSSFGDAVRFPGGATGNCTVIITMRASINVADSAGTTREILTWRPARYLTGAWTYAATEDCNIRVRLLSANQLELRCRNDKGGQSFLDRKLNASVADTATFFNGSWKEYKFTIPVKIGTNSSYMSATADGVNIPDALTPNGINSAFDWVYTGDPYIGAIILGGNTSAGDAGTYKISSLRFEIVMGG